jgi:acyl-CoA thioesterase I
MPIQIVAAAVLLVATLASALAETSATAASSQQPVRILCLGDSITQGGKRDREEYTYRYPLFKMLTDAGVAFDFIGSTQKGLHADATWPDYNGKPFDPDHEGHYGWKTAKIRDHLSEWMKTYPAPADIVLIHLGTNDQKSDNFERDITQPLTDIIKMLRDANPRVVVLVGHLNFNDGSALKIRPLVQKMADDLNTDASPVKTVNHFEGWHEKPREEGSDTFDWAHPNPQGQQKMAQKWFEAMRQYLAKAESKK